MKFSIHNMPSDVMYVFQTQLFRLSQFKKQWNIRGVNLLVNNKFEILLEIIKGKEKTYFNFDNIQLININKVEELNYDIDKQLNIQHIIRIFCGDKIIVLGSVSLENDQPFIITLHTCILISLSRRYGYFANEFMNYYKLNLTPVISYSSPKALFEYIVACNVGIPQLMKFSDMDKKHDKAKYLVYITQKFYYTLLTYILAFYVMSQVDYFQIPAEFISPSIIDIVISDEIQTTYALIKGKIHVSSTIGQKGNNIDISNVILPPTLSFIFGKQNNKIGLRCFIQEQEQTFQKGLITNRTMIFNFFVKSQGPNLLLSYKYAQLIKSSTITQSQLKQVYNKIFQKLTGNNIAELDIDFDKQPTDCFLLPFMSSLYPKQDKTQRVYTGYYRQVLNNEQLSPIYEISSTDAFIALLQELQALQINGSVVSILIVAMLLVQKEKGYKNMYKHVKVSARLVKNELKPDDDNTLHLRTVTNDTYGQIFKAQEMLLNLNYDPFEDKIQLLVQTNEITVDQFLPEKFSHSVSDLRVYSHKKEKKLDISVLHSSTAKADEIVAHLSKKQQDTYKKIKMSTIQQNIEKDDNIQTFQLNQYQIHVGEIQQVFPQIQQGNTIMQDYMVQRLCTSLDNYYRVCISNEININFFGLVEKARQTKVNESLTQQPQLTASSCVDPMNSYVSSFELSESSEIEQEHDNFYDNMQFNVDGIIVSFQLNSLNVDCYLYVISKLFKTIVYIIRQLREKLDRNKITSIVFCKYSSKEVVQRIGDNQLHLNVIYTMKSQNITHAAMCDQFIKPYIYQDFLFISGEINTINDKINICSPDEISKWLL